MVCKDGKGEGFTLIELLTVMFIMSVLIGIFLPVLSKARRQARTIVGANNQRQIVQAIGFFASDNEQKYPESVATIGLNGNRSWQAPTVLTTIESPGPHRAMSEYLRSYIRDASIMFCPNAPRQYKYLQQAWDAGDRWNNPDTWYPRDWVKGTYCFYWNYTGLLDRGRLFIGPQNIFDKQGHSRLLVSCYFGYNCYRSPNAYGSCEKFKAASITPEQMVSSAYWSRLKSDNVVPETINIRLSAAYTDGHVESFKASETVPMQVIKNRQFNRPYTFGPGVFYLPKNGLR